MKKQIILLLIFIVTGCSASIAQCSSDWKINPVTAQPVNNVKYKPGWHLIWDDEFNGSYIDPNFWQNRTGVIDQPQDPLFPNKYPFFVSANNVSLGGGRCTLKVQGSYYNTTHFVDPNLVSYADCYYSGSWISTVNNFGPGCFWEMKGKRNDYGYKSSFWSYDNSNKDGISMFDNGYDNTAQLDTNFSEIMMNWTNPPGSSLYDKRYPLLLGNSLSRPNITDYTYSIDWQSNSVKMYLNNQLAVNNVSQVPQGQHQWNLWGTSTYWNHTYGVEGGNPPTNSSNFELDYVRVYKKNYEIGYPLSDFNYAGGWTDQNTKPRFFADINGDGKKDIVGFGGTSVGASLSNIANKDIAFLNKVNVINDYTVLQGWANQDTRPRFMAELNGDGKADIIGFGSSNVYSSFSNSSTTPSFLAQQTAVPNYYTVEKGGWTNQTTRPRMIGDINGDGKDDIVGFGIGGVYASINTTPTNGTSVYFGSATLVITDFTVEQGWTNQSVYPRMLADVNGDGKKDIVGFGSGGVKVSLSSSTISTASFTQVYWAVTDFTTTQGWNTQEDRPRMMADVNGDGKDDIIGFGYGGVTVAINTTIGGIPSFSSPVWVASNFSKEQGFTTLLNYPRYVCDINNDKKADIVGIGDNVIQIAISQSTASNAVFDQYNNFITDFTKTCDGWVDNNVYPRVFTDVNGDGSLDLMAFGYGSVMCSQNVGGVYNIPFNVSASNRKKSNDWNVTSGLNGADVAYKFYIPGTSNVTATAVANYNSVLQFYNISTGSFLAYSTGTNPSITSNLSQGYYYVIVDGVNGTTGDFTLSVTGTNLLWRKAAPVPEATEIKKESGDILVYPNPANDIINIISDYSQISNIKIFDICGREVKSMESSATETSIDISDLHSGLYFLRFEGIVSGTVSKKINILR